MPKPITITGRLGGDPELSYTPSGVPVVKMSVAQDHGHSEGEGEDRRWVKDGTNWWRVTAWRDQAEHVAESLAKGDRVIVQGQHEDPRKYEVDGEERTERFEITAYEVGPSLRFSGANLNRTERVAAQDGASLT